MLAFLLSLPNRSPHVVLAAVAGVWAVLALLSWPLLENTYQIRGDGPLVLIGYVAAFMIGSWVVWRGSGRPAHVAPPRVSRDLSALMLAVCGLALIGIMLRMTDHILYRGASLALDDVSRRKLEVSVTASESPLGLIAAPMMAFCFLPALILVWSGGALGWRWRVLCIAIAAFPALEGLFFNGGTSGIAYTLIMFFCVFAQRPLAANETLAPRRRLSPRFLATLVVSGVAAVGFGGWMFSLRINEMFGSIGTYLHVARYELFSSVMVPSDTLLRLVEMPVINGLALVAYWFALYVTSGVYNLIYVIERGIPMHTEGGTQGQVFVRAFDILTGNNTRPPAIDANPLAGLYQTIFGDVFIDFGVAGGLFQCAIMGMVFCMVHLARERGQLWGIVLDPILKTFLFMGIFVSSFSSLGIFMLTAGIAVLVIAMFLPSRPMPAPQAPVSRPPLPLSQTAPTSDAQAFTR